MALLGGSPARGAGNVGLIAADSDTDQRGAPRVNGGTVDIGAFESGPFDIVVTTLVDEDNGTINPSLGSGTSLREAIEFVNTIDPFGGDTISFAAGLSGTITLGSALPVLTGDVTITGPAPVR